MGATILSNAKLHVTSEQFRGVDRLAVQDHRIIPMDETLLGDGSSEEIDLNGLHVCPGFIDLLVNGCNGVSLCNEPSYETLETMRRWLNVRGTTTFVPTLISCPREVLTRALAAVAEYRVRQQGLFPGLHLEGPFINSRHKGFHPGSYIRPLTEADVTYLKDNRDSFAYLTLAPEVVKPKYLMELLGARLKIGLGHTACTYNEAVNAFKAGVRIVTHAYNGMRGMTGREPGLLGALYASASVCAGVIPDGRHVHPAVIRLLHRLLGARLYIVSDVQAVAGLHRQPGSFMIQGNEIFVDAKRGLIDAKGSLAGTGICMMDGVRYLVEQCGFTLDEALMAATATPAHVLGLKEHGRIEAGFIGDLIIFDDEYRIRYVMQNGYLKNSAELV